MKMPKKKKKKKSEARGSTSGARKGSKSTRRDTSTDEVVRPKGFVSRAIDHSLEFAVGEEREHRVLAHVVRPHGENSGTSMVRFGTSLYWPGNNPNIELEYLALEVADALQHGTGISAPASEWLVRVMTRLASGAMNDFPKSQDGDWVLGIKKSRGRPPEATARDFFLALEIAVLRRSGQPLGDAIRLTADRHEVGRMSTRKAWNRWEADAARVLDGLLDAEGVSETHLQAALSRYQSGCEILLAFTEKRRITEDLDTTGRLARHRR
jgi:hypothetical protein